MSDVSEWLMDSDSDRGGQNDGNGDAGTDRLRPPRPGVAYFGEGRDGKRDL